MTYFFYPSYDGKRGNFIKRPPSLMWLDGNRPSCARPSQDLLTADLNTAARQDDARATAEKLTDDRAVARKFGESATQPGQDRPVFTIMLRAVKALEGTQRTLDVIPEARASYSIPSNRKPCGKAGASREVGCGNAHRDETRAGKPEHRETSNRMAILMGSRLSSQELGGRFDGPSHRAALEGAMVLDAYGVNESPRKLIVLCSSPGAQEEEKDLAAPIFMERTKS